MKRFLSFLRAYSRPRIVWRRAVWRTLETALLLQVVLTPLPASAGITDMLALTDWLGTANAAENTSLPTPTSSESTRIASIQGAALLHPATPITQEAPKYSVRRTRWRVPVGATMRVLVTGYSSTPDQTDSTPFITASGTHVHDGTVATNFLPFGTKIRFPDYSGDKLYTVEDRHHPRLSDRIDVWFVSRQAAINFGARVLRMEIVE